MEEISREDLVRLSRKINSAMLEELLEVADPGTVIRLVQRFGGDCIYIPQYSSLFAAYKRECAVRARLQQNRSVRQVARDFQYSQRYVRQLVADYLEEEKANGGLDGLSGADPAVQGADQGH